MSKGVIRKALIVSVSDYDQLTQLEFCKNDGLGIFDVLKNNQYQFYKEEQLIGKVIGNEMRESIIRFFTDNNIKEDDLLIFYFSGHGYYDPKTGKTYLTSSDFDKFRPLLHGFPFDQLTELVENCSANRVVVIVDCCYSGSLKLEGKGDEEDIADLAKNSMTKNLTSIENLEGRSILASSSDEHKSFKMPDDEYSLFSYFVIKGLKGIAGESVNERGNVTVDTLNRFIYRELQRVKKVHQKPIKKTFMSGDIVLANYPGLASTTPDIMIQLRELLFDNNATQFNQLRKRTSSIDFSNIELNDVTLDGFDLSFVDFQHATFIRVTMNNCNFTSANFSNSSFLEVKSFSCNFVSCSFNNSSIQTSLFNETRFDYSRFISSTLKNLGFQRCSYYYSVFGVNNELYPDISYERTSFETLGFDECTFYEADLLGIYVNTVGINNCVLYNTDIMGSQLETVGIISSLTGLVNFNYSFLENVKLNLYAGQEDSIISFTGAYRNDFIFDITNDPIGNIVIIGIDNSIYQDSFKTYFDAITKINKLILNRHKITFNQTVHLRRLMNIITKKLSYLDSKNNEETLKIKEYDFHALVFSILALRDKNNELFIDECRDIFSSLRDFMKLFGFSLDNMIKDLMNDDNYPSSLSRLIK